MTNIIICLPKAEDGKNIRNLLTRNGYNVVAVCTNGSQAIASAEELLDGIVITGYKLKDMLFTDLRECLPDTFDMLLMASDRVLQEFDCRDIMSLSMPLKVYDLLNTVEMMSESVARRHRKLKSKPKDRNPQQQALIQEAKCLLMSRNGMSEEEAHRYMQKCSMDSSTNLVETAKMVLSLMKS